jgi:putative zinc finger/helix-turn-helix YgiT family protein
MICFECERGQLVPATVRLTGERCGESFEVELLGLQCEECSFQTLDSEQSAEFTGLISDAYRRAHGLLTSKEILARRLLLGMTQQVFSEYLGAGIASVKRWEAGKIQDKAMDELIRLKTDPAAARKNLRAIKRHVPEAMIVFDGDEVTLALSAGETHYTPKSPMIVESVSVCQEGGVGEDACVAA